MNIEEYVKIREKIEEIFHENDLFHIDVLEIVGSIICEELVQCPLSYEDIKKLFDSLLNTIEKERIEK